MGYHVYLFRKEVKEQNSNLEFLENDNLIIPFTNEQYEKLKNKLLRYGYQIEKSDSNSISFNFEGGKDGIRVLLTKNQLSFKSDFVEDGIFEISQTASEFTDTGEFLKFDPQKGKWEEF